MLVTRYGKPVSVIMVLLLTAVMVAVADDTVAPSTIPSGDTATDLPATPSAAPSVDASGGASGGVPAVTDTVPSVDPAAGSPAPVSSVAGTGGGDGTAASTATAATETEETVSSMTLAGIAGLMSKPRCQVSDFMALAPMLVELAGKPEDAATRLSRLAAGTRADTPLTFERAAGYAARIVRVRSSLVYSLLPLPRYAFRAMVMDGAVPAGSSAWQVMSGADLLEFVASVSRVYGGVR